MILWATVGKSGQSPPISALTIKLATSTVPTTRGNRLDW